MTWTQFLFSRKGRIGRVQYGLSVLSILGVCGGIVVIADAIDRATGLHALLALRIAFGTLLAMALLGLGLLTPLGIKRLHDRDKSGLWLCIFYVLPALLIVNDQAVGAGSLRVVVLIALVSWSVLELCCLRGTPGPNRYGDDPSEPASSVPAR